jgi:predicted phosphodiesterase
MKRNREEVLVIMPDSHGQHIDLAARTAFLKDVRALRPTGIIGLGDHTDCGGTFSTHQRSFTNEMTESYEDDVAATTDLLDDLTDAAPGAWIDLLEGNHEQHVERWASRTFQSHKDAVGMLARYGIEPVLKLKERGIRYFKRSEFYQGISIQGAIRYGRCFYVHGITAAKFATAIHLDRFGDNVVHGHTHRAQSHIGRTVTKDCIGAWCPGTLAKQQPLYQHTNPTNWTHGYGVNFIQPSGAFFYVNVPIVRGVSLLPRMMRAA